MTERPILFNAPMVRALLAGTKTQTRRVVKPQPPATVTGATVQPTTADGKASVIWLGDGPLDPLDNTEFGGSYKARNPFGWRCQYGQRGDQLYVRENAFERPERTEKMMRDGADTWPPYIYDADYWPDGIPDDERADIKRQGWRRRPSIHLPRLGSRILLEITAVRVERLNDISDEDAIAEGIERDSEHRTLWKRGELHGDQNTVKVTAFPKLSYRSIWESINGAESWAANPWVWCVEFRRLKP